MAIPQPPSPSGPTSAHHPAVNMELPALSMCPWATKHKATFTATLGDAAAAAKPETTKYQ